MSFDELDQCPRCKGTGKVPMPWAKWLLTWKMYGPREETCPRCGGSGSGSRTASGFERA